MVHRHRLDEPRRRPGLEEGPFELLRDERRLRGVLHEHRVARQHRRHDHVHRDRQRIVPGRDVEHDADGLVADEAPEARLFGQHLVGEGGRRDRTEMQGALDHRALELGAGLGDRLAHHAGDRGRVLVETRGIGAQHPAAEGDARGEIRLAMGPRGPARERQSPVDLVVSEELEIERRTLVDGARDDRHQGRAFRRRRGSSPSGMGRSVR